MQQKAPAERSKMQPSERQYLQDQLRYSLGNRLVIDRRFQFKYTFSLLAVILMSTVPIAALSLYFLNENYKMFIDLALTQTPELLPHLTHERIWVNICILGLLAVVLILTFFFGLRLTGRLIAPLSLMREHLKTLSRGYWDLPELVPDEDEEFYDLIEAYHYFYKSLRHQTKTEVERMETALEDLGKESDSSKSHQLWKDLIDEKLRRLHASP